MSAIADELARHAIRYSDRVVRKGSHLVITVDGHRSNKVDNTCNGRHAVVYGCVLFAQQKYWRGCHCRVEGILQNAYNSATLRLCGNLSKFNQHLSVVRNLLILQIRENPPTTFRVNFFRKGTKRQTAGKHYPSQPLVEVSTAASYT